MKEHYVIGGGTIGLMQAYWHQRYYQESGQDVRAVLVTPEIHSCTYAGNHAVLGTDGHFAEIRTPRRSRSILRLVREGMVSLEETIKEEDIDCLYQRGYQLIGKRRSLVDGTAQYLIDNIGYIPETVQRRFGKAIVRIGGFRFGTDLTSIGQLSVPKLQKGLIHAIEKRGGEVRTGVSYLGHDIQNGNTRLFLSDGEVVDTKIMPILSMGGAQMQRLDWLPHKIYPKYTAAAHVQLTAKEARKISPRGPIAFCDTEVSGDVLWATIDADNVLTFGFGETQNPRLDRFKMERALRQRFSKLFPDLAQKYKNCIKYSFGAMAATDDNYPVVGEFNGVYVVSGFYSRGITQGWTVARALAKRNVMHNGRDIETLECMTPKQGLAPVEKLQPAAQTENAITVKSIISDQQFLRLRELDAAIRNAATDDERRRAVSAMGRFCGKMTGIKDYMVAFRELLKAGIPDPSEAEPLSGIMQLATHCAFDPELDRVVGHYREYFDLARNQAGEVIGLVNYIVYLNDPAMAKKTGAVLSVQVNYLVTKEGQRSPELNEKLFNSVTKTAYNFSMERQPEITRQYNRALFTHEQNNWEDMNFLELDGDSVSPFKRALFWLANNIRTFVFRYVQPALAEGLSPATNLVFRGGMVEFNPEKIGQKGGHKVLTSIQGVNADFLLSHILKFFCSSVLKRADIDQDETVRAVNDSIRRATNANGEIALTNRSAERSLIFQVQDLYKCVAGIVASPALSKALQTKLRLEPFGTIHKAMGEHVAAAREAVQAFNRLFPSSNDPQPSTPAARIANDPTQHRDVA